MFFEERTQKILEMLEKKEKISVKILSKEFNLSEVTIRKDLKFLQDQGLLIRTHGGAILKKKKKEFVSLKVRKEDSVGEKSIIAKKAFDLIKDGDRIFLDSSTSSLQLAQLIEKSTKKLIIMTNMLDVINVLSEVDNIILMSTGGRFNRLTGCFEGFLGYDNIKKFNPDKSFIGCCGINLLKGSASSYSEEDGMLKSKIIEMSDKNFILAESQKFYQEDFYNFTKLTSITGIITIDKLDLELSNLIKEYKIRIY